MVDTSNDSKGQDVKNPVILDDVIELSEQVNVTDMLVAIEDRLNGFEKRFDKLILALVNNVFSSSDSGTTEDVQDSKEMVSAYSSLLTIAINSPDFSDDDRDSIRKRLIDRPEWLVIERAGERMSERSNLREILDVEVETDDLHEGDN